MATEAEAARLAAYRKLEGRSSVISLSGRRVKAERSDRASIERRYTLRRSSTFERSVWEDSPRSSTQSSTLSFPVARPRRQSNSPISWLPTEILCHIFELVAAAMPPSAPGGTLDQVGTIGWIVVSHVCRHWRAASLGMAALWAGAVGALASGGAAETMLERARGTPITLVLSNAYRDAAFHTAHLHLARALVIDIAATAYSPNVLYDIRTSLAMQPLPALEALTVAHAFGSIPPHNFDLPPVDAPALKRVTMENYFLPWLSSALTDLTLARTKTQVGTRPSFDEILKLLRSAPMLQRLTLKNWVPETGARREGEHRVAMPFLMRIEVHDRPAQCALLWSALALPASAHVVLAVDLLGVASDTAVEVPNAIFRALGPHFRVPHAAPFESVAFTDCRGDSFLRVRASVHTSEPENSQRRRSTGRTTSAPRLSVDFWPWRSPLGITGFQHALAAFALHIGVAHVRTLVLDCSADDDDDGIDAAILGWREPLEPMTSLRSFEMHGRAPMSLIRALGRLDPEPEHGELARADIGRLLLPSMLTLILRPCGHRRRDEARVLAWITLHHSLRQRAVMKRSLGKLQLFGNFKLDPPTRAQMFKDELGSIVQEISWDS